MRGSPAFSLEDWDNNTENDWRKKERKKERRWNNEREQQKKQLINTWQVTKQCIKKLIYESKKTKGKEKINETEKEKSR